MAWGPRHHCWQQPMVGCRGSWAPGALASAQCPHHLSRPNPLGVASMLLGRTRWWGSRTCEKPILQPQKVRAARADQIPVPGDWLLSCEMNTESLSLRQVDLFHFIFYTKVLQRKCLEIPKAAVGSHKVMGQPRQRLTALVTPRLLEIHSDSSGERRHQGSLSPF